MGPTCCPAFQGRRSCTAGLRSECPITLLRWPEWPIGSYRDRIIGLPYPPTKLPFDGPNGFPDTRLRSTLRQVVASDWLWDFPVVPFTLLQRRLWAKAGVPALHGCHRRLTEVRREPQKERWPQAKLATIGMALPCANPGHAQVSGGPSRLSHGRTWRPFYRPPPAVAGHRPNPRPLGPDNPLSIRILSPLKPRTLM